MSDIDNIRAAMGEMNSVERQVYARGVVTGYEVALNTVDRALSVHHSSPGSTAIIDALVAKSRIVIDAILEGRKP